MAEDEITSETVTYQAADWISTLLSLPMIWPRATSLAATGICALGISWIVLQATQPEVPPVRLDRHRLVEIDAHVRQADAAIRQQLSSGVAPRPTGARGFLDAIADADHGGHHHGTPSVQSH
jgi:hypothetical protein